MKLKKLILPIALLTPLFITSCKSGGKYNGLVFDAHELVYAYSQECSTTITIDDHLSDVEFVDNFKDEYFTFNKQDDIKGKTCKFERTTPKILTITFTGEYTGTALSQTEDMEIKYTISKSAFKNDLLENDATGKMHMTWDYSKCFDLGAGKNSITLKSKFVTNDESIPSTKIYLNDQMVTADQDLSNYCSNAPTGSTIKFSYISSNSDNISLGIKIDGLPSDGQRGYAINVMNNDNVLVFNNIPNNYGLKFNILNNGKDTEYSLVSWDFYFEKSNA